MTFNRLGKKTDHGKCHMANIVYSLEVLFFFFFFFKIVFHSLSGCELNFDSGFGIGSCLCHPPPPRPQQLKCKKKSFSYMNCREHLSSACFVLTLWEVLQRWREVR